MFQAALIVIRILLGMALVGGGQVMAAAPPAVNFQQQGTHLLVSGELTVPVSPATAWAVLTDYERVPEFVPGMRVSRVLEQSGNTRVVEQQGEMQANNMRMLFMGTLRITEEPTSRLSVQFLSGTFRNMQGQWTLQGKRAPVTLAYQLDFDAGTPYPSPVMVGMLQQQVVHWVSSLAAEMERRPPPPPEPRKKRRKTP
ncbi:MAG TPA: SRPBCC family protein [Azonexus sp.]|nr:SRPBCC family protein [Azonexus sp.]